MLDPHLFGRCDLGYTGCPYGYQVVSRKWGKNRFWEDQWFGNTSLAIIYWPLYVINEQHGKFIQEVWDGEELKLSFRRNVSESLSLFGKN